MEQANAEPRKRASAEFFVHRYSRLELSFFGFWSVFLVGDAGEEFGGLAFAYLFRRLSYGLRDCCRRFVVREVEFGLVVAAAFDDRVDDVGLALLRDLL